MTTNGRASDQVAEQVKAARLRLGWTAKRLAAECAELGAPEITPAVIANIETGRRGLDGIRRRDVSIDELLIFAYVLGVPPATLLSASDDEHENMAITSTLEAVTNDVVAWLQGKAGTPIASVIADGLACCGTCGSAVRARLHDDSVVYYCPNEDCAKPVNCPASAVDDYVVTLVFEALRGMKGRGIPAPTPDESEWPFFAAADRRKMLRMLFRRISILPASKPEAADHVEVTVTWAWE